MNQYVDDGTETAKKHAALRATNSQVGQGNAPAAGNDTSDAKEASISTQPPTNSPFEGVDDASSVSGGVEARFSQYPRLASIQFIADHKLMGERSMYIGHWRAGLVKRDRYSRSIEPDCLHMLELQG